MTYISRCCSAPAEFVEYTIGHARHIKKGQKTEKYVCEQCGEECSIKEPETEPNEQ